MTRQNLQICCIITWKSRFSRDMPKRCKFVAFLSGKAGFLVTRKKNFYFWCINTWKSRFSHDATENNVYIWCIITFRSRFSRDVLKTHIFVALLHVKAGFLMTRVKGCKCNALLRGKAGFLMTRQKLYIWCINTWKSRFSHDATENKAYICCIDTFRSRFSHDAQRLLYIWCIITWRSKFSHDAPKRCKFAALLRGKAGFFMTRQKLL